MKLALPKLQIGSCVVYGRTVPRNLWLPCLWRRSPLKVSEHPWYHYRETCCWRWHIQELTFREGWWQGCHQKRKICETCTENPEKTCELANTCVCISRPQQWIALTIHRFRCSICGWPGTKTLCWNFFTHFSLLHFLNIEIEHGRIS